MCVVLIGMPSSGKTTLFHHLTNSVNITGYDTDDVICLHHLVGSTHTASDFYDAEMQNIIQWLSETPFSKHTVLATGGSVVHRSQTMDALRNIPNVVVIWLYAPFPVIEKRLGDWKTRGIVMPPNVTTLNGLFAYREPLYRAHADVILDTSIKTIDECASEITRYAGW